MFKKRILLGTLIVSLVAACQSDQPPPKRPDKAVLSFDGLKREQREEFLTAVRGWNKGLGVDFFRLTDVGSGDIGVFSTSDEDILDKDLAAYIGTFGKGDLYVRDSLEDPEQLISIFYHELGHALDIPHSPDPFSIMFRRIDPKPRPVPIEDDFSFGRLRLVKP